MTEFGYVSWCPPFQGAVIAADTEKYGFDVQYFGDNQCLTSDTFSELRAAAGATTRLKVATGVTNLVTRHPAVIASSIAGVHVGSDGRAICGVGKGDSALGMIGLGPQGHAEFSQRLPLLKLYLHGGSVDSGGWDSRLEWLSGFPEYTPVPLEMMASGPRSLALAATVCDRISLAVGAAPERIRWALDIVDQALEGSGRSRSDVTIGAFVNVCVRPDRKQAVAELRGRVKGWAHMASFPGHDLGTQPEIMREVTSRLRDGYDYRHHNSEAANPVAALVSDEFAEWFGVGGPADYVGERLADLRDQGIEYINFSALDGSEKETLASNIFPRLRSA
jgi:5,10-methylenetetrahydromethanopterin reductase